MVVKREVEIDASPDEVWEAVTDPERWLGEDVEAPDGMDAGAEIVVRDAEGERHGRIESADPGRLVWWWWRQDEPATRVEVLVVAAPAATRVVVVETLPASVPVLSADWTSRLQMLAGAARALVACA
jgi:uncharacterized protein YndB with AHSA1/START domain